MDRATVQFERDWRKVCEKSPWATDKGAAEVIRPAPAHSTDQVPLKSVARDMDGTAMHKSPTEVLQNAQRRTATARALREGHDGDTCEQPLAWNPFHSFCCNFGRARARPHRAVLCTLHRLVQQRRLCGHGAPCPCLNVGGESADVLGSMFLHSINLSQTNSQSY